MSNSTVPDLPIRLRARGRGRVAVLGLLALLATPLLADAAPRSGSGYHSGRRALPPIRFHHSRAAGDHIYRHGYRQESTLLLTPSGHVLAFPTVTSAPGHASYGAPLHGIVCSKGTIAELPAERQTALHRRRDRRPPRPALSELQPTVNGPSLERRPTPDDRRHLRPQEHRPEPARRREVRHPPGRARHGLRQSKGWTVDPAHVYVDDAISGAEFVAASGPRRARRPR